MEQRQTSFWDYALVTWFANFSSSNIFTSGNIFPDFAHATGSQGQQFYFSGCFTVNFRRCFLVFELETYFGSKSHSK